MGGTYWNETSAKYIVPGNKPFRFYLFKFRVLLCSSWFGAMIALGAAFVITSSKVQRETNLFRLQCITIFLALLYNLEEIVNWKYRLDVSWYRANQEVGYFIQSRFTALSLFMEHLVPLLADSALLFRLSPFFPFPVFSRTKRRLILGPFLVMLGLRLILTIMVPIGITGELFNNVKIYPNEPYPHQYPHNWSIPLFDYSSTIEYSLASFYCLCASAVLLFKAFKLSRSPSTVTGSSKIRRKMRFFAEALTMCFIPPILFNVSSAVMLLGPCTVYCYFREVGTLNVNLSVVSSLLATSWSTIRSNWSTDKQEKTTYIQVNLNQSQHGGHETLVEVASPAEINAILSVDNRNEGTP